MGVELQKVSIILANHKATSRIIFDAQGVSIDERNKNWAFIFTFTCHKLSMKMKKKKVSMKKARKNIFFYPSTIEWKIHSADFYSFACSH